MDNKTIKGIEETTKTLGELIVSIEPANPHEWDAMEKLQAAHKQLRSIDITELIEEPDRARLTK